jgi:hypothetical protein
MVMPMEPLAAVEVIIVASSVGGVEAETVPYF